MVTAETVLKKIRGDKLTSKEKRALLAETKKNIVRGEKGEIQKLKLQSKVLKERGRVLKLVRRKPTLLKGTKQPGVKGIAGLAKAFLPTEGGGLSTGGVGGGAQADSGRGRGRPTGTFKARYVPGIGVVKVPTDVYKKLISTQKAKARLAAAKQQAQFISRMEAEKIAASQDPRFQQSDGFAESDDPEHLQNVANAEAQMQDEQQRQQFQPPQRSSSGRFVSSLAQGASNLFRNLNRPFGAARQQPQQLDQFGRPVQPQPQPHQFQRIQQPPQQIRQEPIVTTISSKSNILNIPNQFNNRGGGMIGFRR